MKSNLITIMVALVLSVGVVFAEETGKADPESGTSATEFKAGPLALSVTVQGDQGGKATKTPYLGVATSPLSPQLRAQINLPEGMGLSVDAVAKDSPAEKAGIKRYDVLKKFNDQMLCAQEQLAVLVKAAGKGTKVTLVVLTGGKEQNMEVTLGEHDAPEVGKALFSINGAPGVSVQVQDLDKMLQQGVMENLLPEILKFSTGGNSGKAGSAGIQQNWDETRKKLEQKRKELDSQMEVEVKNNRDAVRAGENSSSARAQAFSIYPDINAQSMISVTDAEGTVEINQSNGKRTLKIKDTSGQEIYAGDLNNEADHAAVPEKFRGKVSDVAGKIKIGIDSKIKGGAARKFEGEAAPPATSGAER